MRRETSISGGMGFSAHVSHLTFHVSRLTGLATAIALVLLGAAGAAAAAGEAVEIPEEFRIKRRGPFEFAEKPEVTRAGDRITISFAAKAACDATVAIEDSRGRIVRHLVSGVLGDNAPEPFAKGTLRQTVVWNGKDDAGRYIDDKSALRVRVSLGIRPQFERTLFWVPKRRSSKHPPLMAAAPEGVYVYDGGTGLDSLILYDRDGGYRRTVYPFPGEEVGKTRGLAWHTFVQDGKRLPLKTNFLQCSMLTSGTNAWDCQTYDRERKVYKSVVGEDSSHYGMYGGAGTAMDLRAGRIALVHRKLNRLGTDGTTAGLVLDGPRVFIDAVIDKARKDIRRASPSSAALSPDGKRLYLTGYICGITKRATQDIARLADCRSVPVVMRVDMESQGKAEVFLGHLDPGKSGGGNDTFKVPASVATDGKGRVLVGDYLNDRVQVFSPEGKFLKTIKAYRPAHLEVHRRSGELWVFSWWVRNQFEDKQVRRQVVRYGSIEDPRKIATHELASQGHFAVSWGASSPIEFVAELDSWSNPPRVWLAEPWTGANVLNRGRIKHGGIQVLELDGPKFKVVREFAADAVKTGLPGVKAIYHRQRLYVNPTNERLYVSEGDHSAVGKSFKEVFEIQPSTGKVKKIQLPFDAEDMCFDQRGMAYLRTVNVVGRFNAQTWREVPWDYGEKRNKVGFGWMSSTRYADLIASLVMPSDGNWHHGGMHVSPRGQLAVGCLYGITMQVRTSAKYVHRGEKYLPKLYPGRLMGGRGGATCIHVWDDRGKLSFEDSVPGLADLYGVGIDRDNNLYMMSAATRIIDGRRYYNDMTGTVMKFAPGKGRVITDSRKIRTPIPAQSLPKRKPDLVSAMQGNAWVEGAEWFYGGVGFGGKNMGTGCACWNARFALDYFARSFAPELDRYSVAVLDSAGNLITRIGKYGNVDDGKPLTAAGGPPSVRSIGGDEVALFHGAYLATHTDRRLFIADPGNGRVVGVKLNYAASETVNLKDVPDAAPGRGGK